MKSIAYYNWIAYYTIVRKEVVRIFRIWTQTFLPHVSSQVLYFLIFGKFVGEKVGEFSGISYMAFIVPGLIMMAVINSSYGNVVSSFFSSKFQRNIEELMVSPVPNWVIVAGFVTGGMVRGVIVGFLVFVVSCLFIKPVVFSLGLIFLFVVLTSAMFCLAGLINAIFATKFDDIAIVPNFVLLPLTYLGGVFYSINDLSPAWQFLSKLNPILYLVNGFRFAFHGFSDVSIAHSVGVLLVFTAALIGVNFYLLTKGIGLKN